MHVGLVVYDELHRETGGYRYDRQLMAHLERAGDRVDVIRLPCRSYARAAIDGLDPRMYSRLREPYNVLVEDQLCHPSLWRTRRPDIPVVSLVHLLRSGPHCGRSRPIVSRLERAYFERVDAIVATSADTASRVASMVDLPSIVAPPAGRAEGPRVDAASVRQAARDEPFSIVYIGSVVPRKGLHTLCDAVSMLDGDFELTVVGSIETDPTYVRRLRRRIDAAPWSDRVRILGRVSDDRLEAVLADAHVLAVPSRYESVGMVYLEAMEWGTVPIATAVGGADEFVTHGHDGLVVEPDAPVALASHLARLATDRDRLADLGTAALETAASRPGWDDSMASIRAFLQELVAEQPTGAVVDP